MTEEKITEYYASSEPDLKNQFGTMRGQISYGILESLRRNRLWAVIFACLLIGVSILAICKLWFAHFGIEILTLPSTNYAPQIITSVISLGCLLIGAYFMTIANSFKRVAMSADASEVEQLLLRLRKLWILASLFLLLVLLLWLVLPLVIIR